MTRNEKIEALAKWAGFVKVSSTEAMSTLVDYTRYVIENWGCIVKFADGRIWDTWRPSTYIDHAWVLVKHAQESMPPGVFDKFISTALGNKDCLLEYTETELPVAICNAIGIAAGLWKEEK